MGRDDDIGDIGDIEAAEDDRVRAIHPMPTVGRYASVAGAMGVCLLTAAGVLGLGALDRPQAPIAAVDAPAGANGSLAAGAAAPLRMPTGGPVSGAAGGGGPAAGSRPAGGPPELPARSGHGKRVVFDQSDQQVWLVTSKHAEDNVERSYPVSGSIHDNLQPGSYEVYSKSADAVSFDGDETMRRMVRFTEGDNAAIGFHDIPRDPSGNMVQTKKRLGTPLSAGCIRQWPDDAKALWRFTAVGTTVVVVA